MKRELDKSDIATILAALRMFKETYEDKDAEQIYEDWEEVFVDGQNVIEPLGSEDIDTLCEEIKRGESKLPIVVMEGGIVQEVLNVRGYDVWDWNDFEDAPCDYWDEAGEDTRNNIRATFSALAIRQIQEALAEDMAYEIELENKRRETDPFWMVPADKGELEL